MLGLTILIGFAFLGELMSIYLNLPLPGNVIGLILFIVSLFSGIIKLDWVETISSVIVKHLALFFIPVVVAIISLFPLLRENLLVIIISLTVSTILVLLATGITVKLAISSKLSKKGEN
ncbi:CidA/LrgA family protein [Natranaerobius thermophilus]|uniref:LrgA family protein n=1 Tax=Natranaerobius thermophilus (strain ATCC BAA-1301 / DSM 18059 / JW/NM-WN-LF) TaxID=457570 RepID=B2A0N5_NATTJ|nr:CidA/LrgA family protein [Natranaerobius thermophilus]ACB84593.1 LrgA family protein [Natranaerobius thermophilus JW/NM-WN-LF]